MNNVVDILYSFIKCAIFGHVFDEDEIQFGEVRLHRLSSLELSNGRFSANCRPNSVPSAESF